MILIILSLIGLGAGLGALARNYLLEHLTKILQNKIIIAGINILGSGIAGFLFFQFIFPFKLLHQPLPMTNLMMSALFITGFCGGFTTYATFLQISDEIIQNNELKGIRYIIITYLVSFLIVYGLFIIIK